ncbi:MLP-like protein 28 [Impatiens glandulifera]|uniref:MLP-like protein 28 n=1 Tax=Impatiens glandulifera TaxID=253017 RepID=UPI001FB0B9DB|nr:MLP-like protein 28 [Impatiens glandulifera]
MAQICRLELQSRIQSSPDKLFDLYKNKTHLMSKISPSKLQGVNVLQGDGKSVGSVRLWTYNLLGRSVIAKDRIDDVDEKNMSITFEIIGGEVTKFYKSYKANLTTYSDKGVNFAKWTLVYEKADETVPTPYANIDFLMNSTKEFDTNYLVK